MKKSYRIPYQMFLNWFVPYSPSGVVLMAVLLPALLGALLTAFGLPAFISVWSFPAFMAFGAVGILGYHRRSKAITALTVGIIGWFLCRLTAAVLFGEYTGWERGLESLLVAFLGGFLAFILQRHSR